MKAARRILKRFPLLRRSLRSAYRLAQLSLMPFPRLRCALPGVIDAELIRRCVGCPDPLILDIGCNDGAHSLWLRSIFPDARVYAFEPDPRAAARFREKVGERRDIVLTEVALSDRIGRLTFHQSTGASDPQGPNGMPEGWDLSGSIRPPKAHLTEHPWVKFERTVEVATTTLDAWCAAHDIDAIDFIWMDVQGAELDVFRGAARMLPRTRYLYTEYNDKELYEGQGDLRALRRHLKDFSVIALYRDDVLFRRRRRR